MMPTSGHETTLQDPAQAAAGGWASKAASELLAQVNGETRAYLQTTAAPVAAGGKTGSSERLESILKARSLAAFDGEEEGPGCISLFSHGDKVGAGSKKADTVLPTQRKTHTQEACASGGGGGKDAAHNIAPCPQGKKPVQGAGASGGAGAGGGGNGQATVVEIGAGKKKTPRTACGNGCEGDDSAAEHWCSHCKM